MNNSKRNLNNILYLLKMNGMKIYNKLYNILIIIINYHLQLIKISKLNN
jgi:hypothetical protein